MSEALNFKAKMAFKGFIGIGVKIGTKLGA